MAKQKGKVLTLKVGEGLHSHTMVSEIDFEYERKGEGVNASIELLLDGTGVITHEEHAAIPLPKEGGFYSQTSQREFDPFEGRDRNVFD